MGSHYYKREKTESKEDSIRIFNDFYEAYHFLQDHELCKCKPYISGRITPIDFNYFPNCLEIQVVKANPETFIIDDDNKLKIKTQVLLRLREAFLDLDDSEEVQFMHDYHLACYEDTFEKAIIELANLVDKHYYDNGQEKL